MRFRLEINFCVSSLLLYIYFRLPVRRVIYVRLDGAVGLMNDVFQPKHRAQHGFIVEPFESTHQRYYKTVMMRHHR